MRRLIESRCEERAPVGDATPGEIGIAGGVRRESSLDGGGRIGGAGGVGDATDRKLSDGVFRRNLGCLEGPPRDNWCVGEQERDDDAAPRGPPADR